MADPIEFHDAALHVRRIVRRADGAMERVNDVGASHFEARVHVCAQRATLSIYSLRCRISDTAAPPVELLLKLRSKTTQQRGAARRAEFPLDCGQIIASAALECCNGLVRTLG